MRCRVAADLFPLLAIDRPTDLTLDGEKYEPDGFRPRNITRLCWKVWDNVASGAT
jgi:hypothetical protein